MSWVTGKQAAEMKLFGGPIPGSPNAWALRVEAGDFRMDYLVGFFGRLFTELMTPADLLHLRISSLPAAWSHGSWPHRSKICTRNRPLA